MHPILVALWLMLPAYLPNSSAALIKGKKPIDFGKNFIDGKRIFGDGKTYRGFFGGALCGFALGVVLMGIAPFLGFPSFTIVALLCLSFGAMLGDLVKSFFKRRLGIEKGRPFPLVDQLDFVLGAWLLLYIFERSWFTANFTLEIITIALVLTPLIHFSANVAAYAIGKKDVWW